MQNRSNNGVFTVAIGSLRQPKIEAVKAAMAQIAPTLGCMPEQIDYQPHSVESDIADTPLSIAEMMQGASNRAHKLAARYRASDQAADYYIGMEGGIFEMPVADGQHAWYLQSWVYAFDGETGCYGSSPAVQFPVAIAREFGQVNFELAEVIARFGQQHNSRNQGGAFSLLTKDMLTRQAIFESAVLAAMAPFYHPELYGK